MAVPKEVYVDLHEKFTKVLKLIEDSKFDSPYEPYASKYSATKILHDMESTLNNIQKNDPESIKITAMTGAVYLYLGMVSLETEELSTGESYLQKCCDVIKEHQDLPQVVMVTLNVYNQFGILWYQNEPEKSKVYLEKAETLYLNCKKTGVRPVDIADLFAPDEEQQSGDKALKNFEKVHTLTLYYLAQIYGTLQDTLKSSIYCHVTLERQLDSGDYDPIDWALNAATLSQVFMEQNGFKQARHHLAASSCILDEYSAKLDAITDKNEEYNAKLEVFKHRSADVARCWAKYGLLLLAKSRERLLRQADDDEKCSLSTDLSGLSLGCDRLEFSSLDLSKYEAAVSDKFVLTLQDARPVFFNIQKWLQEAEGYYKLEVLASDYVEIVQDRSQMYLNFLFFEDNVDNQAKLHKRRIDLLESVITKISPQYYLQYCRQIWYELGQTYSEILNIKCDKLQESNDRPSPHLLTKINYLTEKSIYNFTCFIDSFKEIADDQLAKVPDDFERAVLQAFFHVGSLYRKYVVLENSAKLANLEASYNAFKKIVDYCRLCEKAKELIPSEYGVCQEMVNLLPVKIASFKRINNLN